MDKDNKLPRFGEFLPVELEILYTSISGFLRDSYMNGKYESYKQARCLLLEINEAILFEGDE